jgi:hypothetical protein
MELRQQHGQFTEAKMKSLITFVKPNDAPVPVSSSTGGSAISGWLGSDIQYSENVLNKWVNVFKEVAKGSREPGYQGTGNTHSIMAIDDFVFIECEYLEDKKVFLTMQQMFNILEKYQLFLQSDYKNIAPEEFEVEYLAEGAEAFEKYLETGGSLGD